jgi:hypothetical protein
LQKYFCSVKGVLSPSISPEEVEEVEGVEAETAILKS